MMTFRRRQRAPGISQDALRALRKKLVGRLSAELLRRLDRSLNVARTARAPSVETTMLVIDSVLPSVWRANAPMGI